MMKDNQFIISINAFAYISMMVSISFFASVYAVFFNPELYILIYFTLTSWVLAILMVIVVLIYYYRSRIARMKKMNVGERLKKFITNIVLENNRITNITKLKWKRGYQSLWIEIEKTGSVLN